MAQQDDWLTSSTPSEPTPIIDNWLQEYLAAFNYQQQQNDLTAAANASRWQPEPQWQPAQPPQYSMPPQAMPAANPYQGGQMGTYVNAQAIWNGQGMYMPQPNYSAARQPFWNNGMPVGQPSLYPEVPMIASYNEWQQQPDWARYGTTPPGPVGRNYAPNFANFLQAGNINYNPMAGWQVPPLRAPWAPSRIYAGQRVPRGMQRWQEPEATMYNSYVPGHQAPPPVKKAATGAGGYGYDPYGGYGGGGWGGGESSTRFWNNALVWRI